MKFMHHKEDYERFFAERDESHHVLMEISCHVDTAIICEPIGGLHLDGFLAYGAFMELSREEREALPDLHSPWAVDFVLPLSIWRKAYGGECDERLRCPDGKVWGWMASDSLTPWAHRSVANVRGPTPVREMIRMGRRRRINVAAGQFKPIDQRFPALWPEGGLLRWIAHGDPGAVKRLLRHVEALGARHNTGWGKVATDASLEPLWKVEELDGEWPEKAIRNYPSEGGRLGSIRAPYHHRSRLVHAFGPIPG